MIKYGLCSEIFKEWEWEKTCKYVSKIGYHGIEIAPFVFAESVTQIDSKKRKEIKDISKKYNLEITGLHWLLTSPKGLYITTIDSDLREKTKNYFFELIKFCSDLGGRIMVIGSPKQRNIPEDMTYEEAWKISKDFFNDCSKIAKKESVYLCLEPLPIDETNIFTTVEEVVKFVKEINHPNFKMIVDVKSMSAEGKPISALIKSAKDFVLHIHANDSNRRGPGFGNTDFIPIAKALKDINYNGYLSVEVFDFTPNPETIAEKSLEYLKSIWKK
ncbi:MAG: sugar phosphate isomerase/epimerase family protein [Candidatus Firestonebacteria bacterium]